jgi:uncharacterized repeat protein (TIGR02543 family)
MNKNRMLLRALLALALILSFTACPEPPEPEKPEKPEDSGQGAKVETRTLTYNANGGSGTVPVAQTVDEGTIVIIADQGKLTYSGKYFADWNTSSNGKGTAYFPDDSLKIDKDYILYAQWADTKPVTYTVKYDANGGTGTVPEPQTADTGSSVILVDGDTLTRENYSFGGWSTSASGSGTSYAAGASFTVERNITLYAQWIPTRYTITYHANNGTGTVPQPQTVERGSSITIANATLTRSGYHFGGWNTSSSGTEASYKVGSSFTPDGTSPNVILYALWVAPRIDTLFKGVTNDGNVRIRFQTGDQYIHEGTTVYRLYRSTSQYGTYLPIAFVFAEQFMGIIEDTDADWITTGSTYYRVAAVSGGVEVMSTNGVRINKVNPEVYMQYSSYLNGYCVVGLVYNTNWDAYVWQGRTSIASPRGRLILQSTGLPPPPDNYILITGSSEDESTWEIVGPLTIRRSHTYTISVYPNGSVTSSFDASNWTFFTL